MSDNFHLKQGNELLKKRELIEGFEGNNELWNDGSESRNTIDQVIKSDLDDLKSLENKFMKTLSEYSETYKLYLNDTMKNIDGEFSDYLGKNIRTNDGVISYISNLGIARPYESDEVFTGRNETCGGKAINVNADNISKLNFNKGAPMYKNAPCGFDGKNVFIDSKTSSTINLSKMQGIKVGQSSNYNANFPATNAIDGNINTFNHTKFGKGENWYATLPNDCFIQKIIITNRQSCCQDRLIHFSIEIKNSDNIPTYSYIENISKPQNIYEFDNINVLGSTVIITQLGDDIPLHMAEVDIWGTEKQSIDHGKMGYVDGNGILHEYPHSKLLSNEKSGSCPVSKTGIGYDIWKLFTKGSGMNNSSVCNLGEVDAKIAKDVENLNNKLMDITQQINTKTQITKDKVKSMKKQNGIENQYLNDQMKRFSDLYKSYNSIDNKSYSSLDAMVNDSELVNSAMLFKYILWTMIASGVILITMRHLR